MNQRLLFRADEDLVRRRQRAGRVQSKAGLRVFLLQRHGGSAPATLGRALTLPKISGFVRGDPENPGLNAAPLVKAFDIPNHAQEHFLADLLDVLSGKIASQLKNKARSGGIMPIEEIVPCRGFALAAARYQLGFGPWVHIDSAAL